MSAPLFFAVLMVLVFAFGIAMFWQESRRMQHPEAIYGVEDSIEFIWESLGEDKLGLKKSDVRRILEWEMHYLQQPELWEQDGPPIVGGEAAARFTQEKALEAGYPYEPAQIYGVMDLQAAYLEAIGAVGEVVDLEE
ncbi:MAG: hypothetical protein QGM46_07710 [Actinomycetota bacterium]|nr:hypothetical protein [Actinomycetota bacterium]MDK1038913.1 hypothetical protein [Actinomycetota bacterium]MDK1292215.1 hypothetical protein [Actinomycetota bacterium]